MIETSAPSRDETQIHTSEELKYVLRGIPDSALVLGHDGTLLSGDSGRILIVKTTQNQLSIRDAADDAPPDQKVFAFKANVLHGIFSFSALTKRESENGRIVRHPDLFAKDLLIRAIAYFDTVGTPVDFMQLSWPQNRGMSDNYDAFKRHFSNGEAVTPSSVTTAVFNTWSGKIAWQLGFREIQSIDELLDDEKWKGAINVLLKRTVKVNLTLTEPQRPRAASKFNTFLKKLFS